MSSVDKLPGRDIFCTPKNDIFQAAKLYSPLNPGNSQIRLLRVLPDHGDSIFRCELLQNVSLQDVQGKYTAVSYCAGSAECIQSIVVDGVEFNVFANLGHALNNLGKFWKERNPERQLTLWCDQICINQYDLSERSQQVRIMRNIYNFAEQTLVSLSNPSSLNHGRSLRWLSATSNHLRKSLNINEDYLDYMAPPDNEALFGFELLASSMGFRKNRRLIAYLRDNLHDRQFLEDWLGIYDVISSPWSRRAWTCQEFVVSSKVFFMHTGGFVPSEHMREVVKSLLPTCVDVFGTPRDDLSTELNRINPRSESINQDLINVISRVRHRHFQKDTFGGLIGLRTMFRLKEHWSENASLSAILRESGRYYTSDKRDRVYAFLGLADPHYEVIPDYTTQNTLGKTLTDTTKRIILYEDSLDVLTWCGLAEKDSLGERVASWVVDWENRDLGDKHYTILHELLENEDWHKADAAFSYKTMPESIDSIVTLHLWAIYVDVVVAIDNQDIRTRRGLTLCHETEISCGDELWLLRGSVYMWILRPITPNYRMVCPAVFWPIGAKFHIQFNAQIPPVRITII